MQSWIAATLLLASGVSGLRKHRSGANETEALVADSSRGSVANLYTFGCPKVSAPAMTNEMASDGCFPGARIVAKKASLVYDVDIVPALMKTLPYAHPKIGIEFLDQRKRKTRSCGFTGYTYEKPSATLHFVSTYIQRTKARYPEISAVAEVALASSYVHEDDKAAEIVEEFGYRLVGSALIGKEASHLIQNPSNGDCFLTFEGSDQFSDWLENAAIKRVNFCGLQQKVHSGFKTAITNMVMTSNFDREVRQKLGHCRKVEVVGHSRGGAMATLFTGCAHNTVAQGAPGFDEWRHFWWTKKSMRILPSIV